MSVVLWNPSSGGSSGGSGNTTSTGSLGQVAVYNGANSLSGSGLLTTDNLGTLSASVSVASAMFFDPAQGTQYGLQWFGAGTAYFGNAIVRTNGSGYWIGGVNSSFDGSGITGNGANAADTTQTGGYTISVRSNVTGSADVGVNVGAYTTPSSQNATLLRIGTALSASISAAGSKSGAEVLSVKANGRLVPFNPGVAPLTGTAGAGAVPLICNALVGRTYMPVGSSSIQVNNSFVTTGSFIMWNQEAINTGGEIFGIMPLSGAFLAFTSGSRVAATNPIPFSWFIVSQT